MQLTAELAVPSTCLSIYLLQVQQDVFINSCINGLSGDIAHDKDLKHNIRSECIYSIQSSFELIRELPLRPFGCPMAIFPWDSSSLPCWGDLCEQKSLFKERGGKKTWNKMVDTNYVQSKAYTSLNCTTQFVLFKAIFKKKKERERESLKGFTCSTWKLLQLNVAWWLLFDKATY